MSLGVTDRYHSAVGSLIDGIATGKLQSYAPLVSLFQISGKQMTLDNHYQLLPLYKVRQPAKTTVMVARQSGKSQNMTVSSLIRSSLLPYYNTIIVQPRFEQIKRYNSTTFQPTMKSCPFYHEFIGKEELARMALKRFNAGGLTYMVSAFLTADASRGIANASAVIFDEVQDIEHEHIPVIQETMSSSLLWGFTVSTGTPKTTDTTLGLEWADSSQAEWVIPCSCGYYNLPTPDQDLLKMIGKHGCICAKCGKMLNPITGGYVHAYPERMFSHAGYHLSQTIHPMHCLNPRKWADLLYKIDHLSDMVLYNEVLGWPFDSSVVPLTLSDLLAARNNYGYKDFMEIPTKLRDRYRFLAIGIDWDGGGALSDSFTVASLVGLRHNSDVLDCIYAERFQKGLRVGEVGRRIMAMVNRFDPDRVAYDACGNGHVCKEFLYQNGLDPAITIPVKYTSPGIGDIIKFHPGSREENSLYYSLDKSRSLAVIIEAIKSTRITVPTFEEQDTNTPVRDMLALIEMPTKTRTNDTVFLIGRKSRVPDDFAHSLNFACSTIWDYFKSYPVLGQRYSTRAIADDMVDGFQEANWTSGLEAEMFNIATDESANFYQSSSIFDDTTSNLY